MGFIKDFENKIENTVDGIFSRFSSKNIKPVDIISALQRELDKQAITITMGRTVAPNHFTLKLATEDFDKIIDWGDQSFADELAANLTQYAGTQEYVLIGPVAVVFSEDTSLDSGEMIIASQSARGKLPTDQANLDNERSSDSRNFDFDKKRPVLIINNESYVLNKEIITIGRDSSSDIVLDDSGVSRHHAEIRITPKGTIISDMGSTNGLYVEGHKVPAATLVDGNTIIVGRTKIYYKIDEQ